MTVRTRWRTLLAIALVVVLGTGAYVVMEAKPRRERHAGADRPSPLALPRASSFVFRNTTLDGSNGLVASVPLADPTAERTLFDLECDRVDVAGERLACLSTSRGLASTFKQEVYEDGRVIATWPVPGIPSRTRLSPSGRLVASTVFVAGHSYMQSGFSTATTIREVSGASLGNLETWVLSVDGEVLDRADRNFWGVTFVDDHRFYATAASADRTWLVEGNIDERALTALRTNAECPAVSPDHTKVAYKKRVSGDAHWSIAVLDLEAGKETVLAERRHVDDQVTWLDNRTLLYGLPRDASPGITDIWRIDIGAGAKPSLAIENAWSPAITA